MSQGGVSTAHHAVSVWTVSDAPITLTPYEPVDVRGTIVTLIDAVHTEAYGLCAASDEAPAPSTHVLVTALRPRAD